MTGRQRFHDDVVAALGEFLGTVLFLLLGLGGIQAAINDSAAGSGGSGASVEQRLYIAASMGLSLLITAWFFFRITGAFFNPQISLALMLCRIITPVRFILYIIAQILGAIVASALLQALLPGPLRVTPTLGASTSKAQGVFIEMFLTSALVFAVLMLAVERHRTNAFAPIGIGLTLFACQLWGTLFTGAAMNTARAFGPAVATTSFRTEHWIYWLGPTLGALLASAIYMLLRHVDYWRLNTGQDDGDLSNAPLTGNRQTNMADLPIGEKRNGLNGTDHTHVGGVREHV